VTTSCLSAERLDELAQGHKPTDREHRHLSSCAVCRTELAACHADELFLSTRLQPALAVVAEPPGAPLFFGPYTNCAPIGSGGMASVYSATAPDGCIVAVKVCRHADALPYFQREIATMRRVHKAAVAGIPPLLDSAADHIPAYFVTDFFSGGNLARRLVEKGALPTAELVALAERLASILSGLRRLRIVHRDIKPSNILLGDDGDAWLADLGLAREYSEHANPEDRLSTLCVTLSRPGSPPLTVAYMSPEQACGERLTAASDVFALGITLYEAATGRHPFVGKTVHQIAAGIQRDSPRPPRELVPDLPAALSDLILRCLEKKAADRPSAEEIVACCKKASRRGNPPSIAGGTPAAQPTKVTEGAETMSTATQSIQDAVQCLRQNQLAVSPQLEQELTRLQAPHYRIAVVGKYQVGKSTLVNRVFLRTDVLLKEGDGLPTTAVTTEVVHGELKRLEVLNWQTETVMSPDGAQSVQIRTGDIISGEVIANPSAADLARFTTADPAVRRSLTERIAGVRLHWPCASLRRFTLLDTPGVDDPDQVLLANTTYRVIPQADAAILVVRPRMLDTVEFDLLRSGIFATGLSRLMVLVSYDPETQPMSAAKRAEVAATIRAQLAGIGRDYIPVRMLCYDATVDGDNLATPEAIEKAIVEFAEANVAKGRLEKAARIVATDLRQAINTLSAQLASADKTDAERLELLKEAKQRKESLRSKYAEFTEEYLDGLETAQRELRDRVYRGLDRVAAEYNAGFDALTEITAVQTRLLSAAAVLRPPIDDLFMAEGKTFKQAMDSVGTRFQARFRDLPASFITIRDLQIDGGLLARVPSLVLTIADYLLADFIIPGGIIIGSIIRYLAGKLPLVGRFMPARLVTRLVISNVRASVEQNFSEIKSDFGARLSANHAAIDDKLRAGFDIYMAEELEPVLRVLSNPATSGTDKGKIAATIAQVKAHEDALAVITA
jgi:hypothetical protein